MRAFATTPARADEPARDPRRWALLGLLFLVTIVNFVDRQTLSIVAPVLRDDFHLSNEAYGFIVAAFQLGMLVGEVPMGTLMDRRGPRFGLSFAVISWSLANALHATARGAWHFALLRFWLGTGECGNYSGGVKLVSERFPVRERALAIGIFNSASMLGAMIATATIPLVAARWGWRTAFVLPSALGFIWVVLWLAVHPRRRGSTPQPFETDRAQAPTMRALLRVPQTWALMGCRFLVGPVVQLYWYWTPEYLVRTHGLALKSVAAFAWIPYLLGDVGSIGGGWVAAALLGRGVSLAATRRITLLGGAALCLCSLVVARAGSAGMAIAGISVVLLGHTFLSGNMFAAVGDLFPASATARVTALTGLAGGTSGMLFPWLTGVLVDRVSYTPVFVLASAMPLAGVLVLLAFARDFSQVTTTASAAARGG